MNQKELTLTFVMILKKPFGLHGLYKKYSALSGLTISSPPVPSRHVSVAVIEFTTESVSLWILMSIDFPVINMGILL